MTLTGDPLTGAGLAVDGGVTADVRVDPRTDPLWRALGERSDASLFTSPPWISAVCDTYGFTPSAVVRVDRTGAPRAGFAWVPVTDLRGDRMVSLPFGDRAEPFEDPAVPARDLAGAVASPDAPLTVRCLTSGTGGLGPAFTPVGSAAWHGTPLRGDLAEVLTRVSRHARRNLAHADRAGVRVEWREDIDAVRVLHDLHVRLRREKYRLLAQPLAFFEAIWQAHSARRAVVTLLATHGGTVVAGALLLRWNDVVYYKFGASLLAHLGVRPNDAIFRSALDWALAGRAALLDWGISDHDQPGLIAFKDKWATDRATVTTLRAGGERARDNPEAGAMLGELTRLFTDPAVPLESTRAAGELLYRYFC